MPSEINYENEEMPITDIHLSAVPTSNYLQNLFNSGMYNNAGAINCLVIDEGDSNHLVAGANNGGLWISFNRGTTWQPVDDFAKTLKISSIAQNHFRHNEYYYSTGVNIYDNGLPITDIHRSLDGGMTFTDVPIVLSAACGRVNKIVTSKIDSNTVYFAKFEENFGGRLYRTKDNFATVQLVFNIPVSITDFIVLPNGEVNVATGNAIHVSATGDSGTYVLSNTGFNPGVNRIFLSACENFPLTRYAWVGFGNYFGVYKTIDGAASWTFCDTVGPNAWICAIGAKPDDPDFIMAGGVELYVSTNGGATWSTSWGGYDNRSINYDPSRPGNVFITSDFGISSLEVDPVTPTSFSSQVSHDSLLIAQEIYDGDYQVTGLGGIFGCQDLGTSYIKPDLSRIFAQGGDGFNAWCSKQDSNLAYCSSQGGHIYRLTNLSSFPAPALAMNQLDADNNYSVDEGGSFYTEFIMNDLDDQQLYYPTQQRLWRSLDGAQNWTPVSDYYGSLTNKNYLAGTKKLNPIIYWTNNDSLFVLPNAKTATPLSEFGIPLPGFISYMTLDPENDSSIYLIRSIYPVQILHSSNLFTGPVQWTDMAMNFPNEFTPSCLAFFPGGNIILAGTVEGGILITADGGQTWTKEISFPNVQIKNFKIRPPDNKIFIYTFGRGLWTADLTNLVSIAEQNSGKGFAVINPFDNQLTVLFPDERMNRSVSVYDVHGRCVVVVTNATSKTLNVHTEKFSDGIYFVAVRNGNKQDVIKTLKVSR